jgi:serine/threonine-protein kinase HipA
MGRYANSENLLSQSALFLLEPDEARNTIDKMEQIVKNNWYDIARREGVTEKDCEKIASAFAYPGFRLEIPAR